MSEPNTIDTSLLTKAFNDIFDVKPSFKDITDPHTATDITDKLINASGYITHPSDVIQILITQNVPKANVGNNVVWAVSLKHG